MIQGFRADKTLMRRLHLTPAEVVTVERSRSYEVMAGFTRSRYRIEDGLGRQITLKAHAKIVASQMVGHSTSASILYSHYQRLMVCV